MLFYAVARDAQQQPRLRLNHNLHQSSDLVQRFLNVLHPGTYVRPPARARRPGHGIRMPCCRERWLLLFNAQGELLERERLDAEGPLRGIELAENQFHSLVALQANTVMFELKQGPYQPSADKNCLDMYPAEGTAPAVQQEQRWRDLFASE